MYYLCLHLLTKNSRWKTGDGVKTLVHAEAGGGYQVSRSITLHLTVHTDSLRQPAARLVTSKPYVVSQHIQDCVAGTHMTDHAQLCEH